MTDVTYLPEPELALAPGAFGGLVVTALVAAPYADSREALTVIRGRLPMVQDVAWDRATVELRRLGRRFKYVAFVPLAGPSTPAERAPVAADPRDVARHLDADAESVRRALLAAVQGRADAMMALVEPAMALPVGLGALLAEYARDAARADVFALYALRELFDRGGLLIDELVHRSATHTNPTTPGHGDLAC